MSNPFFVLPTRLSAHGLGWVWYALIICALATLAPLAEAQQKVEIAFRMGKLERTATAYLPDDPSRKDAWPLIIALHPGFATGADMAKISKLHRQEGSENFVVVYPDGFRRSWNAGECCGAAHRRNIDDIGFIQRLIEKVGEMIPIKKKVFLAGYSNGAMLAYRLACTVPDRLAAVAVFGGAVRINQTTCGSSRGVPLLHLHGELDASAPLKGGKSVTESAGMQPSVLAGIDNWTEINRCRKKRESDFVEGAKCTDYDGCRGGSETIVCVYPGLGHYWPGSEKKARWEKLGLGPARTDLNGGKEMVRFFNRHD